MTPKYNLARRLRRALTPPEFKLWERLKTRHLGGPVFRRQYAIGPYVLDMYCHKARLAIEVDGQHHGLDEVAARDARRDEWLRNQGIATCRINAADIYRDPDEVADGVYRLTVERMNALRKPPSVILASAQMPPPPARRGSRNEDGTKISLANGTIAPLNQNRPKGGRFLRGILNA